MTTYAEHNYKAIAREALKRYGVEDIDEALRANEWARACAEAQPWRVSAAGEIGALWDEFVALRAAKAAKMAAE